MPPPGGLHMNGTGEAGRTATEHRKVPDDGFSMQHCQGGAGKRAPNFEKVFTAVQPLIITFLPHSGETAHSKTRTVPARRNWHQPTPQQAEHLQQIGLRKRPLQRQGTNAKRTDQEATNTTAHQQNHYSGHNVTMNRLHTRRPTPIWPDMHGPVQERRPTGWRHRGESGPPTTMPANTEEHHNSTTTDATNQR